MTRAADVDLTLARRVLQTEAAAILALVDRLDERFDRAVQLILECRGHVILTGMGKSGIICRKIAATFSSTGTPALFLHPAEAIHGDLGKFRRSDVVLLLSYSGQTEEVVNLAAILKSDRVRTLGISCGPKTALALLCDVHVSVGDVTEACPLNLAPTASTTAMLAIGDALALALSRRRNFGEDDFHKHHPGGMLGVGLRKIT